MLETIETRAEKTDSIMLLDGSLVPADDAKITMTSLCSALNRFDGFAQLDRLHVVRLWADDLEGYIDCETQGDTDAEYAEYKKIGVNELLKSPIFEVSQHDEHWTVPPHTAVAVLRNMVGINTEDGGEIWLQEPCANRELLAEVWEKTVR
jgi:hypothetical protein